MALLADTVSSIAIEHFGESVRLGDVDSFVSPRLVATASARAGIDVYAYRALHRERGIEGEIFGLHGQPEPYTPVVLVDDVITTLGTVQDAVRAFARESVPILGTVCLLDRRVPSDREDNPPRVEAAATLTQLLSHGLAEGYISPESTPLVHIELDELA